MSAPRFVRRSKREATAASYSCDPASTINEEVFLSERASLAQCAYNRAMSKPHPNPVDPAQVPALARQVVAEDRFPMLATMDGDQPRLRPVSPVKTVGFTI